jgi:ferredoxin
MMEVLIKRDHCIGSGMCMSAAPEVFDLDHQSKAYLLREDLDGLESAVEEAAAVCPVEALTIRANS